MEIPYYDQLVSNDVVGWVKDLLDRGGWTWRYEDGRIVAQIKPGMSETPWHHVKPDYRLNCAMWHQIMFSMVSQSFPKEKQFVPSKCQNCFKVVVRPKTLSQLFALMELEMKLGRPCKCGIELRDSVHALYGGYFYNVGLVEGLECYDIVVKAIKNEPRLAHLEPEKDIFLKRSCTEYEHACGNSDAWTITPEQLHVEAIIEKYVVVDNKELRQPQKMVDRVHRKWIEYAYSRGDSTYADYTGGKPLYPKYKSYQHWLPIYREKGIEALKIEGR